MDLGGASILIRKNRYLVGGAFILIRKNRYLVTLAVFTPRRNSRSQLQTAIFTIENQHFLVQVAPEASWPPDVSAESLEARIGPWISVGPSL